MATKYLDTTGLTYLWGKIKSWVQNYTKITTENSTSTITIGNASLTPVLKDGNKVLSDNNYTTAEKNKLDGIAAGAEVNQNAFGKVKVGSTNIEADAKIDTLELAAATNSVLSITPDATNDKVTFDVDKDLSKYNNSTAGFITINDVPEGSTASTTTPKMDGTAAVGTETAFARGDHRHPSDTTKANLASPTFTGTPSAPTATAGTNTTQIATTAFVTAAITAASGSYVPTSSVGAASGVCPLDSNSLIDSQYLPSYVDDVVEAMERDGQTPLSSTWLEETARRTPITPEVGKIYVLTLDTADYAANSQFRWGGTTYVKLNDGGVSAITNSEIDSITAN